MNQIYISLLSCPQGLCENLLWSREWKLLLYMRINMKLNLVESISAVNGTGA